MRNKVFVTGGAGYIGSNLVDRLLSLGHEVVAYDNFSTGCDLFLKDAQRNSHFRLVRGDVLDLEMVTAAMHGSEFVFHLAANADIMSGLKHPRKDLEQNTLATFNVLEAMRANEIKEIAFSSTGAIYGEAKVIPTPEDGPFPIQTSLYGASKLACEGLISAYAEGYGMRSWIFRFVGILGERYPHGHIFDLYKKLLANPKELHVLGNGTQRKSYLYIQDCIDAILVATEKSKERVNIFNLGTQEYSVVSDSVKWIIEYLGLNPRIVYGTEDRGWIGDNPFVYLDTQKIRALGWGPKLTIQEATVRTLAYLQANQQLMTLR